MLNLKLLNASLLAVVVSSFIGQSVFAQSITDPTTPLIPGALGSGPFIPPPQGAPPAPGDGSTPLPVTPGMGGPSTLLPWVPAMPANSIDSLNSGIPLPVGPPVATPPGVLGPMLTPFIPGPASTPGPNPGSLMTPLLDNGGPGDFNAAQGTLVNPGGGLPGMGGYNTTINTIRRGGQQTHQWELRGRNAGMIPGSGDGSQGEVEELGPYAGWGVPFGVPTGDGLRNSSIDLGGGMQMKVGGVTVPTGNTILDYGTNAMRGNPIMGLGAQRSFDFGQGFRNNGIYSNATTDYGFPYQQFNPANVGPQATGQLLQPTAIETNF